ncbi:MAG: tRNA lysidine(34) synthetase TilS [Bacilli bacterium]|nr:tRNA lysidine(34) synthetase TilS [Bacilli bacterium]
MDNVYNYLLNEANINYGDSVVLGVSGGPDSMALLHMMLRIKKALDIQIICGHVNHNSGREGQDADEKLVKDFCNKNNIVFESMVIKEYGDDNFHNEARSIRYNYFHSLIKKYHAKILFTAHHGDDLVETILMRLVRGSTLRGYSGFSKEIICDDYKIIRPFIKLTKKEIIEYNKQNKIKYAIDSSNSKDVYTRNRFRKYIVPHLKEEEKNVHLKFLKFSETLLEYNNYIDKQVQKVMKKVCPDNVINIELFIKEEKVIQMKIIYFLLEYIYQDDLMLITDHHAKLIYDLIYSSKANSFIYLPNNVKFIKNYNNLLFEIGEIDKQDYEIEIISYLNLPNGKNIEVIDKSKDTSNNTTYLLSSDIVLPLRVRNRQIGDKMVVKGMLGKKKISDIFIDSKIPMQDRNLWPIVVDSENKVVWVPGLKKSKFDKQNTNSYDIILKYY